MGAVDARASLFACCALLLIEALALSVLASVKAAAGKPRLLKRRKLAAHIGFCVGFLSCGWTRGLKFLRIFRAGFHVLWGACCDQVFLVTGARSGALEMSPLTFF